MFIRYLISLKIIAPLTEWTIHKFLHDFKIKSHKEHHIEYFNKTINLEHIPILVSLFGFYFSFNDFALMTSQYWIIHSLIHHCPSIVPKLSRHHDLHHNNPTKNFAVSSRFPDYIFKTLLN